MTSAENTIVAVPAQQLVTITKQSDDYVVLSQADDTGNYAEDAEIRVHRDNVPRLIRQLRLIIREGEN
jgi:hypothetical protein